MCGERQTVPLPVCHSDGSSPRVRGTAGLLSRRGEPGRFIPACAGNGRVPPLRAPQHPVHPRVCGERIFRLSVKPWRIGSSPRVRGTGRRRGRDRKQDRFIPACAGNGSPGTGRERVHAVHPRVCGERSIHTPNRRFATGSSPRVRGTGVVDDQAGPRHRFIPACAGNGASSGVSVRGMAVHPRVCGERSTVSSITQPVAGSSPRVRGTGPHGRDHRLLRRFIPACAGNGRLLFFCAMSAPVHPRVCGERLAARPRSSVINGSSPRVRGTAGRHVLVHELARFIPACAGNGPTSASPTPRSTVHPRVCGERPGVERPGPGNAGSSPRVRGTEVEDRPDTKPVRFIPACAGNGWADAFVGSASSVHPRVCGERDPEVDHVLHGDGSSPRVRGTGRATAQHRRQPRFIPACAGNGEQYDTLRIACSVHPRVCGERSGSSARTIARSGSSPRVRGTVALHVIDFRVERFIPACAGNGSALPSSRRPSPVHPRVCGERDAVRLAVHQEHGSSPRVRGTGFPQVEENHMRRFIPACAGNGRRGAGPRRPPAVHPRVCGERGSVAPASEPPVGSSPRVRGTDLLNGGLGHRGRFIPACAGNGLTVSC